MAEPVKIFSPELREAYQATFNQLGIRLHPNASIQELHTALEGYGVTVEHDGTMLVGTQNGNPINIATSLRALSTKPELGQHFVGGMDGITHLDDFKGDLKTRCAWISKWGEEAYAQLVKDSLKPARPAVSLDPDRATREDAKYWTPTERTAFINAYGAHGYGRVLARKDFKAKK